MTRSDDETAMEADVVYDQDTEAEVEVGAGAPDDGHEAPAASTSRSS